MDVVFLLVGKGRSELFVIFFPDAKNARAIPDHQLSPMAKDPLVTAEELSTLQLHTLIAHNGGAEAILLAVSQTFQVLRQQTNANSSPQAINKVAVNCLLP